ncbi:MAG: hypothetical protein GOMPHAMPRED_001565 [Gomphillus americanus]|uniref:Uncharacterized protein n=1 Tax=Gomphillus americanus TaxID=1940652 RepID=A0A8H3FAP5_9LECA|nr:MAG: hypothetical protein GOMPHAMPRED_001565 [Gomphillus americanus]
MEKWKRGVVRWPFRLQDKLSQWRAKGNVSTGEVEGEPEVINQTILKPKPNPNLHTAMNPQNNNNNPSNPMPSSPPPSPPKIHIHANPQTTLIKHLTTHLPTSLPLLRRIQFHHHSPHAYILATFPSDSTPTSIWSAAFVDRSRAPETECWIFSSTEAATDDDDVGGVGGVDDVVGVSSTTSQPSGSGDGGVADVGRSTDGLVSNGLAFDGPTSDGPTSDKLAAKKLASAKLVIARAQLLALLRAIREQSPLSSSSPHHQQQAANSNSKNSNKTPLIIGAVHSRTLSLLTSVTQSCSSPWLTFLYRVGGWSTNRKTANSNNNNEELLSSLDLVWGTVVESEFAMVRSRTAIPRSDATGTVGWLGVSGGGWECGEFAC